MNNLQTKFRFYMLYFKARMSVRQTLNLVWVLAASNISIDQSFVGGLIGWSEIPLLWSGAVDVPFIYSQRFD